MTITVYLKRKEGQPLNEKRVFEERYRPGGSWGNSIRYEGAFAIIKDAYENETAIPAENIEYIQTSN